MRRRSECRFRLAVCNSSSFLYAPQVATALVVERVGRRGRAIAAPAGVACVDCFARRFATPFRVIVATILRATGRIYVSSCAFRAMNFKSFACV